MKGQAKVIVNINGVPGRRSGSKMLTATLPPERDIPEGASFSEFRSAT